MRVADRIDPAFHQNLQALRRHTREYPDVKVAGRPVLLLHGPPGTGKTHAMRMLSQLCQLTPWTLDLKAMADSWSPQSLFTEVLKAIDRLSSAIVFMDECESVLRDRGPMMSYASVMVTTKVELIDTFLTWTDGLERGTSAEMDRVLLCLSTNMFEHLDRGVVSRCIAVKIGLPALPERRAWWAQNAKHLDHLAHEHLGALSEGLSFRDLVQIADRVEFAAARHKDPITRTRHCDIASFEAAVMMARGLPTGDGSLCMSGSQNAVDGMDSAIAPTLYEARDKLVEAVGRHGESLDGGRINRALAQMLASAHKLDRALQEERLRHRAFEKRVTLMGLILLAVMLFRRTFWRRSWLNHCLSIVGSS